MQNKSSPVLLGGKHTVVEFLCRTPERVSSVFIEKQKKGKDVSRIIGLCREGGIRYQFIPGRKFAEFELKNHQGFALRVFAKGYQETDRLLDLARTTDLPLVLVLDQVQDEGNLGTLARSLFALGGAGMVLPRNRTAPPGGLAQQAAAGAMSELPLARETNLTRLVRDCREKGFFTCYAGTGERCRNVFDQDIVWPVLLVLGNEEKGVRPGVARACETGLTIPMSRGFDSLNVAQAGAMLLVEMLRKKIAG
ncbi:MAG: 23S rRNA (guanosine(2251)-2'-O)-methyltransferase RlmB [Desulfohalobiaceae bacterium]|nr:23S rRNA (guanosine(2251)-2'-O)-methyltransferase RlmB [Desulfohalobiaceae bacterium]